ncbi:MAG: hypothetical protein QOC99_479 [Acidobacteriota bacterium]|nr:hypothetical protein [Acidobacteriota bacterium]
MIYTFYSYKGGVGRSMALANVAKWFYLHGLRVVIVDWDLEAPGLENFFFDPEEPSGREQIQRVQDCPGLIDLLIRYQRKFPALPIPPWPKVLVLVLEKNLPPVLPEPLAHVDIKLLLKALEQQLPSNLRPSFDSVDTVAALRVLEQNLPATLSGSFGERKTDEVLEVLRKSMPPTLIMPFEQADSKTLLKVMEDSWMATPRTSAQAGVETSSAEPDVNSLLAMLANSLSETVPVSFDEAYMGPLLKLLEESVPETLPVSTRRTDDGGAPEGVSTKAVCEVVKGVLPPSFIFTLRQSYAEALLSTLEENLPPFSAMLYPVYEGTSSEDGLAAHHEATSNEERPPGLWLLSSGWRFGARFPVYAQNVQGFDWTDFYNSFQGEAYFEWVRNHLNRFADVVLIDSRTGVTEMGGVCTRQLADVVVSFVAPNGQNLDGVATMVESFRRKEVLQSRRKWEDVSTSSDGALKIVIVPARVETSEVEERNKFEKRFRQQSDKLPAVFQNVNSSFWDLKIPYISYYAYNEKLVIGIGIGAKGRSEELEKAYQDLGAHLAMLAPERSAVRKRLAKDLRNAFPTVLPGLVLIAYAPGQREDALVLCGWLEEEGVSMWEGVVAIEEGPGEGQQLGGIVDQCESVVIVASPESATSGAVLRQWRYARQQGKCVYLVGRDLAAIETSSGDNRAVKSGLNRLPKSAETFDLTSDWRKLARKLQSPCRALRVPFMSPAMLTNFVGRVAKIEKLKEILLIEDRQPRRRSGVDVAVCGMGGGGKSALATVICYDEDVLTYFDGGILWATLGASPDILGELTKMYSALTSERMVFADVDEACRALAEKLSGQSCLMVVDDVWDRNDLRPFISAGAFCSLLITTRDRSLAAENAAQVVLIGEMETPEAVEFINSQIGSPPQDLRIQDQLATLVERLGNSALAIRLAGAELRRRVEQGYSPSNAVEYLKQALDVQGVAAFDTPDAQDRDLSVAKSIALSLDRLTEEERKRYVQLAEFDEFEEIPLEQIGQKWGMDSFKTEQLVQRLSYQSLLIFSPERKLVRLHTLLRSYIIDQHLLSPPKKEEVVLRGNNESAAIARNILRGQSGGTPEELYKLAMQLKSEKLFGLARRILIRARKDPRLNDDKKHLRKTIQQLSLCTRKDSDLPTDERLDLAFEILRQIGEDLNVTKDQETLGLAGAVFKNKWEVDGQIQHLERSLAYYRRGHQVGVASDYGYTGINAAYVLDLLADQEEAESRRAGTISEGAAARRREAERIREEIAANLPGLARQPGQEWLAKEWWFLVTIAEAFFGLKKYDESLYWLKEAAAVPKVADWEYEATARQLASIARLQDASSTTPESGELKESKAWEVLRVFLRNDADAVRSTFVGKVGLALSGGGFRASLFHIGVLAKLAELDVLRSVEVLSCVSGGSIIGAHYYLEVRELLQRKPDSEITRQDYVDIVRRIERDFLDGVQRNLRTRVAAHVTTNLKMIFLPNYSRTERVGELYESEIFSRVGSLKNGRPLYLNELMVRPADGPANFVPRADNWRRAAKVPVLILNATTLNTGHNWQFTTSWMGEPPSSINTEVDGNDRLRRMYYQQAPKPHNRVRLGHAVAASACVPALFEPLALSGLYPEKVVRLVDGGVHDNQGIAGLLGEDCTTLLVSDASGQMAMLNNPGSGLFGVSVRSNSILMARVREVEYREVEARRRSSLLRGLMFIHLKKDLEVDPVDWVGCDDPYEDIDDTHLAERRGLVTPYGMRKDVQQSLSAIRTDLDSFSDKEAYALMASGYRMAGHEFPACIKGFPSAPDDRPAWRFLSIEKQVDRARGFEDAHSDLMRSLNVGSARTLKVWKLLPLLPVGVLLGFIILVAALLWLYMRSVSLQYLLSDVRASVLIYAADIAGFVLEVAEAISDVVITPVGAVVATTLIIALLIFGGRIIQLIRRYKPLSNIAIGIVMASVGWIAAGLHLHVFDRLFLKQGRVETQGGPAPPAG